MMKIILLLHNQVGKNYPVQIILVILNHTIYVFVNESCLIVKTNKKLIPLLSLYLIIATIIKQFMKQIIFKSTIKMLSKSTKLQCEKK